MRWPRIAILNPSTGSIGGEQEGLVAAFCLALSFPLTGTARSRTSSKRHLASRALGEPLAARGKLQNPHFG
jgi:hypothetical protein